VSDHAHHHLTIGEFRVDFARGNIRSRSGTELTLRPQSFEVLKYLALNEGRVVGRHELMQAVWPDTAVTDDSLVQCIHEIRRVLDDHDHTILRTVMRRGYCLKVPRNRRLDDAKISLLLAFLALVLAAACAGWCLWPGMPMSPWASVPSRQWVPPSAKPPDGASGTATTPAPGPPFQPHSD
jgi:DNA-binding winged helix-turn-helix (wHTH) protein